MPSVASHLLKSLGIVLLAIASVACSSSDDTTTDVAWGSESLAFFEELSLRHEDGDIYGVLDFYAITAEIDKSRGELSGPARVSDRIRWNSGDLIHETLTVNVAAGGTINIVRWASNDELGAVLGGLDNGVITHQTVFDLGADLSRGLRAAPSVVAFYEDMYARYAEAWSRGNALDPNEFYTPDALVNDSLAGIESAGVDNVIASRSPRSQVDVMLTSQRAPSAPSVFLGPSQYGNDPNSAVGVYLATDENGCRHQVAVHWLFEDGLIVHESRYREVESFSRCVPEPAATGWWTGLELPNPSDTVITGVLATSQGQEVDIYNGTERLEDFLEVAIGRFAEADVQAPHFDRITFEPSRSCVDRSGRVVEVDGERRVYVCIYERDLCPDLDSCATPSSSARVAMLHELGHAWMLDHVDPGTQSDLLEFSGRETWQGTEVPWVDRGVEYAADVIAWGLLGEPIEMVRIRAPGCEELTTAFRLLTAAEPLGSSQDCAGL